MIEWLIETDTALFGWINGHHCTAMDWVLWTVSQHWAWGIVLVLFFVLVSLNVERGKNVSSIRVGRKEIGVRAWVGAIVGVAVCFLIADQGSVHLLKETVCRLRPCHALEGVRMFRTRCGGQYGFVSSHAANAFAITTFLWLRYRKTARWGAWLMVVWAMITSYSRVYLGKHYPGDVVCGGMFGAIVGWIVWAMIASIEKKVKKSGTKK